LQVAVAEVVEELAITLVLVVREVVALEALTLAVLLVVLTLEAEAEAQVEAQAMVVKAVQA
jgi:hypothetical protein